MERENLKHSDLLDPRNKYYDMMRKNFNNIVFIYIYFSILAPCNSQEIVIFVYQKALNE